VALLERFPEFAVFPGRRCSCSTDCANGAVGCINRFGQRQRDRNPKVYENWKKPQADQCSAEITTAAQGRSRPIRWCRLMKSIVGNFHNARIGPRCARRCALTEAQYGGRFFFFCSATSPKIRLHPSASGDEPRGRPKMRGEVEGGHRPGDASSLRSSNDTFFGVIASKASNLLTAED